MVEENGSKGPSKAGKGKGGKKGKGGGKKGGKEKGGKEKGGKGADAVSRATTELHIAARAGDLPKLDELIAQAKEQAKVEAAKAIAARDEAEAKAKAEAKPADETKEENAEAGGAGLGGEGPKAGGAGENATDSPGKVPTKEELADANEVSATAGGSDAHEPDSTAEANASTEESKQLVRLMNVLDQHRRTPLHLAAFSGQEEAVEKLLENGADLRKEAMDGYLPLHFAAQAGHVGVLRLLVRRLAAGKYGDVKRHVNRAVTKGKRSALQLALQKKHADCARFLVSKGAVIDDDCREDMKELCGEAATLLAMKAAAAEARKSSTADTEGGGPVGPSLPPGAVLAPADAQIGPALPPAVAAKLARALAEEEEPVAAEGVAAEAVASLPAAEEDSAAEPAAKRARVVDKDLDDDDCI